MAFIGTHHGQISVTSGYWTGAKGAETLLVDSAGTIGSGRVDLNSIAANFDYGTTGFSGVILSVSTRLTSIVSAVATPKYDFAVAGSGLHASGKITTWAINWSGGALDFQTAYVNTSTNTSAPACSGILSWIAFGT